METINYIVLYKYEIVITILSFGTWILTALYFNIKEELEMLSFENKDLKSRISGYRKNIIDRDYIIVWLNKDISEIKENRDKVYNKHNTRIAYYKKRCLSIELSILWNFNSNTAIIKLIKSEIKRFNKMKMASLYKLEQTLSKEIREQEEKFRQEKKESVKKNLKKRKSKKDK